MYCPHKTPQSIQHRLLYTRRLYGCEKAITDKCRNNWRPARQYVHWTCCYILPVVVTGRTSGAGCSAGRARWSIPANWLLCNVRAKICAFYKRHRSIKKQRTCDRRQRPQSGAETPVPSLGLQLLPQSRHRDFHLLAVFCHGTTSYIIAEFFHLFGEFIVGERFILRLALDNLF